MQHYNNLFFSRTIHWLKWLLIVTSLLRMTHGAKILGIFPHASEGHFVVMRTLMMELAKREHNVTIYSSHRLDDRLDNLKEKIIEPEFQFWKAVQTQAGVKDLQQLSKLSDEKLNKYLAEAGLSLMDYFLNNSQMQELLKISPDDFDYDLIIVDVFYSEALLALGYYFRTPVIGVVSTDFANYMDQVQENLVPSACLPYSLEKYDKNIGFWQRLSNVQTCLRRRKEFVKHHYGNQEKIVKKHFKLIKGTTPSIPELQSYLALLLVNNYYPLATPKPFTPNIIPVGGLQIRAAKELPWNIRRYLDDARSGAIYMHLGDEQLCADIPKDKLDIFFHVFSKREERILWTCHDVQKMDGLPKNVMIQHFVPQIDILAHPHIKLFIMNGDILGLQDGIIRHVPVLGIPMFKNELENIILAENLQIGVRVDYTNLTETSLNWALDNILHKDFYVLNIRDVSKAFRDRPLGGLANALFWIDYILRYGSNPLNTQGLQIPLNQLHLSDLTCYYFLMSFVIVGVLVGLYFLGMFLWKKRQTSKMYSKLN